MDVFCVGVFVDWFSFFVFVVDVSYGFVIVEGNCGD